MPLHNSLLALRAIKGEQVSIEPPEVHYIRSLAPALDVAELYKQLDELRADRDAWKSQAQRLALRVPPLRR